MLKLKIREKISGLLVFYFVVALAAIGSTLFVSRHLEGSAAAINEAGRERMRSYRIALLLSEHLETPSATSLKGLEREILEFEQALSELENGNPQRPLFLPEEKEISAQIALLHRTWEQEIKRQIYAVLSAGTATERKKALQTYRDSLSAYVRGINEFVEMIEKSNAEDTQNLRSFQIGLIITALLGTILLDFIFSIWLVRPVEEINRGLQRIGKADFGVRLPIHHQDEFGELSRGFNQMAGEIQNMYSTLEKRVAEKTQSVESKNRELRVLYDIVSSLNASGSTEQLGKSVLDKIVLLVNAQGGVLRLMDPKGEQLQLIASNGVSESFLADEACLPAGSCLCTKPGPKNVSVIPGSKDYMSSIPLNSCSKEGFSRVVTLPIRAGKKDFGVINLFFDSTHIISAEEMRILESIGLHLGTNIENQRLVAKDREIAVYQERNLLAQELHDSIAQSLAFLNIQTQLLHDDLKKKKVSDAMQTLGQIREGIQESYDDVRELLVYFRTRIEHADLDSAIRNALEKFEGQTGITTHYTRHGPNPDVAPEHMLQILHILQESLSNIRKHSKASLVEVELANDGACRLTVRDNGCGFDLKENAGDSHIGIHIMRERAHKIKGQFEMNSRPNEGTQVSMIWTENSPPAGDTAEKVH